MIDIPPSPSSPRIFFAEAEQRLTISGDSYPENTFEFYQPVFSWLKENLPALSKITMDVNIRYMNSSSTKCMLDILDMLDDVAKKGCNASVRWYYEVDNERARDIADEFQEDVDLPFEIIAVEPSGTPA